MSVTGARSKKQLKQRAARKLKSDESIISHMIDPIKARIFVRYIL